MGQVTWYNSCVKMTFGEFPVHVSLATLLVESPTSSGSKLDFQSRWEEDKPLHPLLKKLTARALLPADPYQPVNPQKPNAKGRFLPPDPSMPRREKSDWSTRFREFFW
jgi:hypothetical protein